jgi:hypothetical protein
MSGWERMIGSWLTSTHDSEYRVSLLGQPPSRQVASISLAACQKRFTAGWGTTSGSLGAWVTHL